MAEITWRLYFPNETASTPNSGREQTARKPKRNSIPQSLLMAENTTQPAVPGLLNWWRCADFGANNNLRCWCVKRSRACTCKLTCTTGLGQRAGSEEHEKPIDHPQTPTWLLWQTNKRYGIYCISNSLFSPQSWRSIKFWRICRMQKRCSHSGQRRTADNPDSFSET